MTRVTRRHFATLAGTALLASRLPKLHAAPAKYLAGIQLYAVRDPMATDPAGTLKQLGEIGFREVETAGYAHSTPADYRRYADAAGIKIPSAHVDFQNNSDLGSLFSDVHALGAHYAVSSYLASTSPGAAPPAPGTPPPPIGLDGFQRLAERINGFGKAARAAGLQYAYHNHNHEFEKLPDGSYGYDLLLRQTDHDTVKFEIDCGWMTIAGADPLHYFKAYPGRFRMLHVKDFQKQAPTTLRVGATRPQGAELGHGFIDYRPILRAAHTAGVEHIFAEQEGPYVHPQLESAKVSYEYLESVQ